MVTAMLSIVMMMVTTKDRVDGDDFDEDDDSDENDGAYDANNDEQFF
jgi:hypothetical protein